MDKTRRFSPLTDLPENDVWLDRLSYRRLLSVAGSLLIAVKSPTSELRKALNAARRIRRSDRSSQAAQLAREALVVEIKQYLQRHRSIAKPSPHIAEP